MILKTKQPITNQSPATGAAGRRIFSGLLFSLLALTGCNYFDPGSSYAPEVTGRVLAADTQQPLTGVKVTQILPGQSAATSTPACGAQLLQRGRPETTGTDGRFVVPGRQYVTLFRHACGWSVRLTFQAPGYALYQTNYTMANITNPPGADVPVVNTGDIWLNPKAK